MVELVELEIKHAKVSLCALRQICLLNRLKAFSSLLYAFIQIERFFSLTDIRKKNYFNFEGLIDLKI